MARPNYRYIHNANGNNNGSSSQTSYILGDFDKHTSAYYKRPLYSESTYTIRAEAKKRIDAAIGLLKLRKALYYP